MSCPMRQINIVEMAMHQLPCNIFTDSRTITNSLAFWSGEWQLNDFMLKDPIMGTRTVATVYYLVGTNNMLLIWMLRIVYLPLRGTLVIILDQFTGLHSD
jgi:hypothetical protein